MRNKTLLLLLVCKVFWLSLVVPLDLITVIALIIIKILVVGPFVFYPWMKNIFADFDSFQISKT